MSLSGKKILIAVCGGIAAYKINFLIRLLKKQNTEIQVIITPDAENFVSKVTLSALSGNPVFTEFYDENGLWNSHVEMALWADLMLIAPCTANSLAKITTGICDNLVMATYFSAKCPVLIAPAMDLDMYRHPTVKKNLETAESFGVKIIPAEFGELASGLIGEGRMAEPETILNFIEQNFQKKSDFFTGKKILITAGPTYEVLNPVRFIGNYSSGKMGYAIAETAANLGAEVTLISGPVNITTKNPAINLVKVTSAKEMLTEVMKIFPETDIAIASAAVADYAPKIIAEEKIKKNDENFTLELVKNPDILKTMGEHKTHQFLAGFALETQNEEEFAKAKLEKKNLDMIVLNSLRDSGAGFRGDTNKIKILTKDSLTDFPLKSKKEVAEDLLNFIEKKLQIKILNLAKLIHSNDEEI